MKDEFLRLVGGIPQDPGNEFRHRFRVHQGWWRTAVLLEEPGPHPTRDERRICNTINITEESRRKNFLTPEAYEAAEDAVGVHRSNAGVGIIAEPRLWGNLLSSSPSVSISGRPSSTTTDSPKLSWVRSYPTSGI